jgi:uncharacterized protein (UPF0332 family)
MSLNDEERRIIVNLELEKATNTMAQISELQKLGYWDNIANRLYYAVFHAVNALLINDGHPVNTHRGVIAMFGNYYIRTGIFASEDGRLYSDLQTMRNNSDYNCSYDATQQEIEPMIEPARLLISKVSNYLNSAAL